MYFNPKKVAFSRHESFVLRFGWLMKGFRAFEDDPNIFTNKDAVVTLGVGKNMVNSIRHWLRASKLIVWEPDTKDVTSFGRVIFSKGKGIRPIFYCTHPPRRICCSLMTIDFGKAIEADYFLWRYWLVTYLQLRKWRTA
ncbi:DUF4007 family protein [Desulfotignum balticum]|jgi:hypothetical protein|uniref:DUF4007 family protein n=1 Tax=Desulfotignum balticum TaxID=115781 RepID=UPI000462A1FD|nr:DUF4007 family protein [Desulfotignum balticum]